MEVLDKIKGESARDYVLRVLKYNILHINLKPGQNISENEIAEELSVSRTPVREAFIRLSQEELLEIYPQKGTSVSLINMELVSEGRFVRKTLEKSIVRMACTDFWSEELVMELEENMNMQEFVVSRNNLLKLMDLDEIFHRIIFKYCKKERTCSLVEGLSSDFYRIRMLRVKSNSDLDEILAQHKEIMNSIKERDPERAERAMDMHLSSVKSDQEVVKRDFPHFVK